MLRIIYTIIKKYARQDNRECPSAPSGTKVSLLQPTPAKVPAGISEGGQNNATHNPAVQQ